MVKLTKVEMGAGRVTFFKEVPEVPETSTREGNVTVVNKGSQAIPPHFAVEFLISVDAEHGLSKVSNLINWTVIVPNSNEEASYREVENQAAKTLSLQLKEMAEKIDKDVAEFDGNREKKLNQ